MPSMAVFCSSLISCFPAVLLGYVLNDLEMVPVARVINGILLFMHSTCAVLILLSVHTSESFRRFFFNV